jgi:hypothetical protein
MGHECHAAGCSKEIPPRLLMCFRHWRMVPRKLQITIWNEYRSGQEVDKRPSLMYLVAQRAAVALVAQAEGRYAAAKRAKEDAVTFWELAKAQGLNFRTPENPSGKRQK